MDAADRSRLARADDVGFAEVEERESNAVVDAVLEQDFGDPVVRNAIDARERQGCDVQLEAESQGHAVEFQGSGRVRDRRRRIQLEGLRGATADARAPEGLAEVAARDRESLGARAAEQRCKNRNRCTSKNVQFLSSTRFPGNRGVDWPVVSSCLSEL